MYWTSRNEVNGKLRFSTTFTCRFLSTPLSCTIKYFNVIIGVQSLSNQQFSTEFWLERVKVCLVFHYKYNSHFSILWGERFCCWDLEIPTGLRKWEIAFSRPSSSTINAGSLLRQPCEIRNAKEKWEEKKKNSSYKVYACTQCPKGETTRLRSELSILLFIYVYIKCCTFFCCADRRWSRTLSVPRFV